MSPTGTECADECMARFKPDRIKRLSLHWQDSNAMYAKPDLRVVLEWAIAGLGSVIAGVILRNYRATTD